MYNIKTLNKIANEGLDLLGDNYKIIGEDATDDYEGIILRSFKLQGYEFSKDLCAIARAGAGVNNVPVEECSEKGIVVFNSPGANANAVKELVIAGLLMSSRNIVGAVEYARSLEGQEGVGKIAEKNKSNFVGPEIMGKTVGVIGLGAIGALVSNACVDLGMNVLGYDPFISVDSAWNLNSCVEKATNIETIFEKADYISIHVPLMDATKNIINEEAINSMKDGIRILNFARGGLVDNVAMTKALESGKVSYYVCDFISEDILGVKNVIPLPHLGASTPESEINCAVMAANEIKDYLENGNITNSVNYPKANMGKATDAARICVLHANKPNMIGGITQILAKYEKNIKDLINKSKGNYAYTMLDIESKSDGTIKKELEAIDGIFKVRIIQ